MIGNDGQITEKSLRTLGEGEEGVYWSWLILTWRSYIFKNFIVLLVSSP